MSRPARVTLRVDGVLVGSASGTISNTFSNATVLLGEGSNPAPASDFAWDDTHLWRGPRPVAWRHNSSLQDHSS